MMLWLCLRALFTKRGKRALISISLGPNGEPLLQSMPQDRELVDSWLSKLETSARAPKSVALPGRPR